MSHLVALLSRVNEDVTPILISILKKIPNPKEETYKISLSNSVTKYKELPQKLEKSHIALATNAEPQENSTYLLGSIQKNNSSNIFEVSNPKKINFPYSVVKIRGDSLSIARDPVGTIPIYGGKNQKNYAISTHMKYLWAMGMEPKSIQPGNIIEVSSSGVDEKQIRKISQPALQNESINSNVKTLDKLLKKTVTSIIPKDENLALGFSGGIDSTILAHYLKENEIDISLVCVGLENSSEFEAAERAAYSLNLPLNAYQYPISAVEENLEKIIWIIEECNPVNVGIGISLLWATRRSRELGNTVFFSGGGADELFGGYHKYLGKPRELVRSMIFNDVINSYKKNYERDYKVCQSEGLDLKIPYANIELIEYGLSLPVSQKIPENPLDTRKIILRALAKKLGLPEDISNKPKKAFQYSTGVNKVLLKLAKKNGLKLNEYLKARFDKVKKEMLIE